jgi:hypothetical protein
VFKASLLPPQAFESPGPKKCSLSFLTCSILRISSSIRYQASGNPSDTQGPSALRSVPIQFSGPPNSWAKDYKDPSAKETTAAVL